ncbi:hypothetical protein [uncultured Deefgea sp.]|uniref:hypothetical protein n=1 Tax=uncultured Deefgea sp. TaxID=1304914 RepID=UPI002599F569|nr:hypothetical protein [uncultured Deefgea sp.]
MLTGLGIVTVVLLAALFWYYVIYNPAAQTDWERLPTLTQYRQQHPQCVRGEQTLCCHCGSAEHLDLGLLQSVDVQKFYGEASKPQTVHRVRQGETTLQEKFCFILTDWRRQMMCRQCKNRLWRESD